MFPKILLVDDRADNLMSIEAILESRSEGESPYRFVKATSGNEALKILLRETDFALILMDVQMPNLNGFETAALIYERQKLKHIPIIFITAHNYGEENIYKGYRAGAVDYIYKPVNAGLLKAKVSIFIDLYKKNYQLVAQEQKLIAINKNLEAEINERKNSEERVKALNLELLKTIDGLEAANKDLDRFAFMASHDLQEPLRKIFTFSDRLASKYGNAIDDDGKLYISKIQHAVARLQLLIKDILTFSTISTQRGTFVESNLNTLIDEVIGEVEATVKEKDAQIVVEKLPNLAVNPVLIRPLFYNLIGNSLKYSKPGVPPVIRIYSSTPVTDAEVPSSLLNNAMDGGSAPYCRIFVEDNGIGFDQQYSEQIFSMFTRLHHDSQIEGTGIGLALCKKIVEEHHGFISAKSKINVGSTFIVSLPLQAVQTAKEIPSLSAEASGK